ncbi:hypothetical protein FHG64_10285 [Antarcticibacterium flavum]|uniref:Membrane or secreted protein n=1 Tax=Antarcticibacterium flavum TaxID=2058175 RepID=A0A5B7X2H8_9FLAO|nr:MULTISPECIES: hypothetical protein [Antarcticibacterium]MCM4160584.1 hypothetical protein [Antarcticibacterium sp. W02-3]QCY69754.1 hypothetical protein FHG64_10285 [Antarcticibacterium flavum]
MKKILFIPLMLFCGILFSQDLDGSWKLIERNGDQVEDMEVVKIIQDGYFAVGEKMKDGNKFHSARGGEFQTDGDSYMEIQNFNTENPEFIGKEINYTIDHSGNRLTISDPVNTMVWDRISNTGNELTRNWVFTGRERDGELSRSTPGDRRTVKILSGDRFQWIAFNSATGEFSGTGGGTYTAKDGKYTENIEFFSRDDSRVGASLEFDYEVKDGEWHHKGLSSKGDPIYEIWSPYEEAYTK